MKITKRSLLILTVLLFTSLSAFSQTALEIIEQATESIDISSMEMTATLKIYDAKGRERVRQTATATKEFDGTNKTIVKFTAPADVKGTSMLIYDHEKKDDDMWIYLPALRKIRRIVSSEKGKSFMGSEFSNADMSKPNIENFSYLILGTENYDGKVCWKVETTCNNEDIEDENGYSKKISWIEKENYLCHKIEFYDLDGELHKIQNIKDYRKQSSGKYFAFYMEKENVQNGRKSVMIINRFQENSALPESAFTPAMLEK
jgi:outer membrane lipoprotein-sorting protein